MARFADRAAAGAALAAAVARTVGPADRALVFGLPRGGLPVAVPVAAALDAPLDLLLVRKLLAPGQQELAMGAVARLGPDVVTARGDVVATRLGVDDATFAAVRERAVADLDALAARLRPEGSRPVPTVTGRVVVVVDDGLATGATMQAAVRAMQAAGAARVVAAVPVGAPEACDAVAALGAEVVCPYRPREFRAVSLVYDDFAPTRDDEVRAALSAPPTPR